MKKAWILGLGPKRVCCHQGLLMAQGMVQCTNEQSQVWYHSAIHYKVFHTEWLMAHWKNKQHNFLVEKSF